MSLPALTRGLTLLEELIRYPGGLRYRDLKAVLPGVGDASLNRLLSSLVETGHIEKREGLYLPSSRMRSWNRIKETRSLSDRVREILEDLVSRTGESAGFCLYREKKIIILHSISCPDSINIIGSGHILHYESDHGASLAVMDLLTDKEREEALNSSYSSTNEAERLDGKKYFYNKETGCYADRSRLRVGISRLALPWREKNSDGTPLYGGERGALFLCLPTVRLEQREALLSGILAEEQEKLS